MNPQESENEDNARLRRAREHVTYCVTRENEARVALALASEATKRAREKHNIFFADCELRAVARRLSGQIVNNPGY